jgi:hypothetical protein
MKLADHTELIRKLIDKAFRNRLGRMGITENALTPLDSIPSEYRPDRSRIEIIREVFIKETGTVSDAFEKLVEELTFTLFNRIAALKVMEAHTLHPEIITRRTQHGDRSFAHLAWLEQNNEARSKDAEGLVDFFEEQLTNLEKEIPLFSPKHPYHLVPTPVELNTIINAFNQIETDSNVDAEIWKSDDVLGWLYESYNNQKKADHKTSKKPTEFNKVSLQSQIYTPRWVVQFLVDNSLGKFYLEMYPHSAIKEKYKIANAPSASTREIKPLTEIRLIDPSNGSGNFLLYAFDVFYDLYLDNINEQGNPDIYDEANIAKIIIENNLHGVDLDDRAVQLAQLGLYIKAKRKKRTIKIDHFNVVSSDFFLPEYSEVRHLFENGAPLDPQLEKIVTDLWKDLQQAYKFGSLIRLEEKFNLKLHGLVEEFGGAQVKLFSEETLASYEQFRENFFDNLQKAVAQNTAKQGQNFLNTKTQDAITFLSLLTQKYDIAVANPPYTDSGDFGPELKSFINSNYSVPYKFNSNLYAAFLNRCYELLEVNGKMALLHPLSFMYIPSFEDVRKFILSNVSIDLFIEFGLGGIFTSKVDVDVAGYIMNKSKEINKQSFFMNLQDYKGLSIKKEIFEEAYSDYIENKSNKHNYIIDQAKFKEIKAWPFIYNISETLRKKFENKNLEFYLDIKVGLQTGSNERFNRYWWEVEKDKISTDYLNDKKKWVFYAKGGPYNKWYGNNWAVVNWEKNGFDIKNFVDEKGKKRSAIRNEDYYLKNGITYTASGSSGVSFRYHPTNFLFDVGGSCIFTTDKYNNLEYLIAFLNSNISFFLADKLNPTVNTQVGDLKRVPFILPDNKYENEISELSKLNIEIKKKLVSFRVFESNFLNSPLIAYSDTNLSDRILCYLNQINSETSIVLLNEAIINKLVFDIYHLSNEDILKVEDKFGKHIGQLPLFLNAKNEFLLQNNHLSETVKQHINTLEIIDHTDEIVREINQELNSLYTGNNDFEDFCIKFQINPINAWFLFKRAKVLPPKKTKEIVLEYLSDVIRTLLILDEDGIIPLVSLPGEPKLIDRLEQHCSRNFTNAQFMQLDTLLGKPINDYLEHYFFDDLGNLLNLFRHMPKTPFIWHLSSGDKQGFEAYIIIYKWNRDSLFKLKTQYLAHRIENLEYRLIQLQDVNTAQAQNEKETIRYQLEEIKIFTAKIDELIAENYDPKLDDGVGKNIAPLQKKGLLRADVLKAPQLIKYLKADW